MPIATLAPSQTQPCAPPPPPKKPTKRSTNEYPGLKPVSLLFVDTSNQTRSVLAHATAELLRLQTLNSGAQNPFTCIDSAGLYVSSDLITHRNLEQASTARLPSYIPSKPGVLSNAAALRALFHAGRASDEEIDVRDRLRKHESRGLEAEDFARYDFIVAFDREDLDVLAKLRERVGAGPQPLGTRGDHARVVLLGGEDAQITSPKVMLRRARKAGQIVNEGAVYAETARQVWDALERFLGAECGWQRPKWPIAGENTPLRSRQFLASPVWVKEIKLKHLREAGEWQVAVDEVPVEGAERVVTVTAAREVLGEALDLAERQLKRVF